MRFGSHEVSGWVPGCQKLHRISWISRLELCPIISVKILQLWLDRKGDGYLAYNLTLPGSSSVLRSAFSQGPQLELHLFRICFWEIFCRECQGGQQRQQ